MLHMLSLALLAVSFSTAWAAPMCSLLPASSPAAASAPAPTATGTSGSPSGGLNNQNQTLGDIIAYTWYAGWHSQYLPPQNVSWSKYTAVTYAFAITTSDVNTVSLADSDEEVLPQFVDAAHQNNVKALLTIGGWTGSQYFSTAVATEANRTAFVKTMTSLVTKYDLDGLDFDWEYPGKQGMGCNAISPDDSANFLLFLQALRADPTMSNKTMSAAVSITPFVGSDGQPMSDVSGFSKALDWIAIMNYDVWGSWSSTVGPNAPLNDTCAPSADQDGSAVSAVKAWTGAGFPASQLVLGVASYGHSFSVSQSAAFASTASSDNTTMALPAGTKAVAAYPQFDASTQPLGDSWDVSSPPGVDQCGNQSPGGPSGIFNFWGLIEEGYLTQNGTAASGMGFLFDECSQTPYVYNPQQQVMVSYDDAQSFAAKGKFINDAGLAGFAVWEAAGDYKDILVNAILGGMGAEPAAAPASLKRSLARRPKRMHHRAAWFVTVAKHLRVL